MRANADKSRRRSPSVNARDPLVIEIELPVVEGSGTKLHGELPPVVSEMVANAWDAGADRVEITLPEGP